MKKLLLLTLVLVFGCGQPVSPQASSPKRIVSLAPAITEILFAIGAGDKVVGVTNYCNYPDKAKELIKVGDFALTDFEKIIALTPDLVIATRDGNPREVVEKIQSFGIRTLVINSRSFDEAVDSILTIGKAVNIEERAKKLSEDMRHQWDEIGEKYITKPRPAVLLLVGVNPLVAAGEGSLGDNLICQAGGRNVFADSGTTYVQTSYEAIISLGPAIILQSAMGSETNEQARERWEQWTAIPAVKNQCIHVLNPDLINRPGPRSVEALKLVESAIHGKTSDK